MWNRAGKLLTQKAKLVYSATCVRCASAADSGSKWTKPSGFDTGLMMYNSLTKRKETLILAREGAATWYSCGPTVYDHSHLGHACSYVRFDIVQRILTRLLGITVIHAMVITDIDDKIIKRSLEENISPTILARFYEDEFKKDMMSLKVIPPAVYLRVTENVPQIVGFIERIIRNGHAYPTEEGDVYFDISSIGHRYGKFAAATVEPEVEAVSNSGKKDVRDFALWKRSKPQEPYWESPWGPGRPGWHIECSTVASSVFGSQLDIHSGGIDLAFPHHENEVAQSEAYHQCGQWANYFIHSGHLHVKGSGEKMSKSLKNYITIKDFLKAYTADEFRMFCLLTKYRSGIEFSEGSMRDAQVTLGTISNFCHEAEAYMRGQLQCASVQETALWERLAETKSRVQAALTDDFDTARAMSEVMNLVHHGYCQLQPSTRTEGQARSPAVFGAMRSYVRDVVDMFGIALQHSKVTELGGSSSVSLEPILEQLTNFRCQIRAFALTKQDHPSGSSRGELYPERLPLLEACDKLRDDLGSLGVTIKDRGSTSTWEITRGGPSQRQRSQENQTTR
ncbi:putative cysteine--tRNA ligase, mitochondrial [Synchiropus picturatus]